MTEVAERVAVTCPACSPGTEVVHEVLSPGGRATVRCTECGHVHKAALPDERTVTRTVVASQSGDSVAAEREFPADDPVAVGDEFVLETEAALLVVRVTDVERRDGGRTEAAPAEAVQTVWTRAVGNVAVDATVHPADGSREQSRSRTLRVPGDYEFVVGEREDADGEAFVVETVLLRDEADAGDKLTAEGETALAKDVKRLYGRAEGDAWSPW